MYLDYGCNQYPAECHILSIVGNEDYYVAMRTVFVKHLGSEISAMEEIQKQMNEMLESEEEYQKKEQQDKLDFANVLLPLIAAIEAEPFKRTKYVDRDVLGDEVSTAIKAFKEGFKKCQRMTIDKGMHFRHQTLIEAYEVFLAQRIQWNYDHLKSLLLADVIIAAAQSFVPAHDADEMTRGLLYRIDYPDDKHERDHISIDEFYEVVTGFNGRKSLDIDLDGSCLNIEHGQDNVARGRGVGGANDENILRVLKAYIKQKYAVLRPFTVKTVADKQQSSQPTYASGP